MTTQGVEGLYLETHNWGRTVAFWQANGYVLEFETDHHSGQLRNPAGGPYIFVAERPEDHPLQAWPVLTVADADAFVTPKNATVEQLFTAQHWGVKEMRVRDPDGRLVSYQAPLRVGEAAPAGHG